MFRKKSISLVLWTLAFLLITGGFALNSGLAQAQPTIDQQQEFTFSSGSAVIGLNPILNTTAPDNGLQNLVLETLVGKLTDENSVAVITPAVARDWKISNDGTIYTFYIREDAVWNDGVPVTAHDFVYTFRKMATPEVGSTNAWLFDGIILNYADALYDEGKKPEDIGVRAIGDKIVEFKLIKPCAYFLQLLNGAKPVRQDKYEEWGEAYGSSIDKVVLNGPFVIESWNQNVQMTLTKNEKYWDGENTKLARIKRRVIKNPGTAAQSLLSGDIDVLTPIDPDWKRMIKEDGRFKEITSPGSAPEFLSFNCANKYFKNEKIRLAFSLSFDREKYIEDLVDGNAEPLYSLMPSVVNCGNKIYSEVVGGRNQIIKILQKRYPDPRALLIEGLKEEGLDPDPAKMEIRYATRGTNEFSKKSAEWLLQHWQETLGVTITIDMMEWNIMWDKVNEGDYDIATAGWGPYYNDPNALLEIYDPVKGFYNSSKSGWTGPDAEKFSQLLVQAAFTTKQQSRAELLLHAEEILVGTGVIAPTYCRIYSTFLADYVHGYYVNPHAYTDYTIIYTSGKK